MRVSSVGLLMGSCILHDGARRGVRGGHRSDGQGQILRIAHRTGLQSRGQDRVEGTRKFVRASYDKHRAGIGEHELFSLAHPKAAAPAASTTGGDFR